MRKVLLGVFLSATFAIAPALADEMAGGHSYTGNELTFGATAPTNGTGTLAASTFTYNMNLGYHRMVMPNLQVGIRGGLGFASTAQPWNALIWGVWNFDEKLEDSFFLGIGAGLNGNTLAKSYLGFVMGAELGKRFELAHGVIYRPTVNIAHTFSAGQNWILTFNVLSFSGLW